MGLFDSLKRLFGTRSGPVYEMDKAVVIVFANLPKDNQQALDHADIELILKLESRYVNEAAEIEEERSGGPPDIDMDAMAADIQAKARLRDKELELPHIHAVLDAELVYMRKAGLVDE